MATIKDKNAENAQRLAAVYNLLVNLFWTALSFVPACVFCYRWLTTSLLLLFIGISLLPAFLPRTVITRLQLFRHTKRYKKLGVALVQYLTQNGVIVKLAVKQKHKGYQVLRRSKKSVKGLLQQTYVFEKFHLAGFVFFLLLGVYASCRGLWGWTIALTLINLLYNLYPILLQQYIRLKLAAFVQPPKNIRPSPASVPSNTDEIT